MTDRDPEVEVRPQEQLLIDALDAFSPDRVLCTSQGVAQLAAAAAQKFSNAAVYCHYLDLYQAEKARRFKGNELPNLTLGCSSDFPPQSVDLVALPFNAQGDAELTRELLQEAHQRLKAGGVLVTSTDNPHDRWLHEEMRTLFATVTRRESSQGTVYLARRDRPLKRVRNFRCEFVFRDHGRMIHAVSRPGVFSHREVDPGARQLMAAMEITSGDRVLDIGCGSGTVSLAAAFRAEGVGIVAVDSHARAVECTALGASRNGLGNIAVEHSACGPGGDPQSFDVVVANPPYYAGFRIARFFLEAGHAALRPAAAFSSSPSGPSGMPNTCHSGSKILRSGRRRTIGLPAGGACAAQAK